MTDSVTIVCSANEDHVEKLVRASKHHFPKLSFQILCNGTIKHSESTIAHRQQRDGVAGGYQAFTGQYQLLLQDQKVLILDDGKLLTDNELSRSKDQEKNKDHNKPIIERLLEAYPPKKQITLYLDSKIALNMPCVIKTFQTSIKRFMEPEAHNMSRESSSRWLEIFKEIIITRASVETDPSY